jgi:hypothetical protein
LYPFYLGYNFAKKIEKMKNKISTLALAFLALGTSLKSSAQTSEIKHFTVGLGVAYEPYSEQLTQHTKFDYNISPKFAVGLRNNLNFWDRKYTQENEPDAMGVQTTISWRNTIFNNSSIVGSYTILGTNQNDKKFNLSVFAGLGFRYDVFRQDYSYKNLPSTSYMMDRSFTRYSYLIFHSGLTASYKIGPGRIFVDIPVFTDLLLYQKISTEFDSAPSLNSETTDKYTYSKNNAFATYLGTELGFNLGYQINF